MLTGVVQFFHFKANVFSFAFLVIVLLLPKDSPIYSIIRGDCWMESVMKPSHPCVCVCLCVSLWFIPLFKVFQLVIKSLQQPVLFWF